MDHVFDRLAEARFEFIKVTEGLSWSRVLLSEVHTGICASDCAAHD